MSAQLTKYRSVRLLLCAAPIVVLSPACGWQQKVTFESPSKHYRLEIFQPPGLPQAGMRLDLVSAGKARRTIYNLGHEIFINFAHAYWSPDESVVGFFACGSGPVEFAYDLRQQKTISFDQIAAQLRKSILRDYPQATVQTELKRLSPCDVGSFVPQYAQRHPNGSTY